MTIQRNPGGAPQQLTGQGDRPSALQLGILGQSATDHAEREDRGACARRPQAIDSIAIELKALKSAEAVSGEGGWPHPVRGINQEASSGEFADGAVDIATIGRAELGPDKSVPPVVGGAPAVQPQDAGKVGEEM